MFAGKKRTKEDANTERMSGDAREAKRPRVDGTDMALEVSVTRFAESRALELEALSQAVEQVGGTKLTFQRLPRHMRRSAMSHNIRRVPRRLRLKVQAEIEKREKKGSSKRPSRRHRRRPSNLLSEYQRRQRHHAWLETHIWHAKRFKMTAAWGYRLPLHPSDKSLRACYRATMQHCLLQDISYECFIELQGPRSAILDALGHIASKETGLTFAAKTTSTGQRWGEVTIYSCDSYPTVAVSPVTYLWSAEPTSNDEKQERGDKQVLWIWCHPASYSAVWEELLKACSLKAGDEQVKSTASASQPRASSSDDKASVLQSMSMSVGEGVASSQPTATAVTETKVVSGSQLLPPVDTQVQVGDICLQSLKDKLVRFRLTGPASNLVLSETLKPARVCPAAESTPMKNGNFEMDAVGEGKAKGKGEILGGAESKQMGSGGDCRDGSLRWWQQYYAASDKMSEMQVQQTAWDRVMKCQSSAEVPPRAVLALTVRDPRLLLPPKRSRVAVDEADTTTDPMTWKQLPLASSVSPLWDKTVRCDVTTTKMLEQELNKLRSQLLVPGSALELGVEESRVPVLLLHRPGAQHSSAMGNINRSSQTVCMGLGSGWDLIIPRGWGMAFWVALVYRGARVGGLREARSLAARAGELHFPHDFPDTPAGEQLKQETRQQLMDKHHCRPPAKRCNFSRLGVPAPFHCPFSQLVSEWEKKADELVGKSSQAQTLPKMLDAKVATGFHVLRCRRLLRTLSSIVKASIRGRSTSQRKTDRSSGTKLSELLGQGQNQALSSHLSSIVPVTIACLLRGVPAERAMICLPTDADLKQLDKDPDFRGPIEHLHPQVKNLSEKDRKKSKKKKKAGKADNKRKITTQNQSKVAAKSQQSATSTDAAKLNTQPAKCAKLSAERSGLMQVSKSQSDSQSQAELPVKLDGSTDRTVIGYLTNGSFDFGCGHGAGLGFCALAGLLVLLRNTESGKPCLVLIRNTTSRQYRFARLSILP